MLYERRNDTKVTNWKIEDIIDMSRKEEFFVEGDLEKKITSISSLWEASDSDLAFCSSSNESAIKQIEESNAGIILCKKNLKDCVHPKRGYLLVFLDNPRFTFVE